ncbi:MAG: hypothetical protein F6K58_20140 [Symploca sp. SIO2E9]|nr:hypothetical protein [Symploca sp. SIO2E9]
MGRWGDGEMNLYVVFVSQLDNVFLGVPLKQNGLRCKWSSANALKVSQTN